jgi:sugar phosphate isomerase/epimerase
MQTFIRPTVNFRARRRFLATAAAGVAAIGAGRLLPDERHACWGAEGILPPVAVFGKIFQELKLDFQQSAEVTAETGFDGVDCAVRPRGEISPEQAADQLPRYAEALVKNGTRMLLLATGIQDIASPHARDILTTAKRLGVRRYRLGFWTHQPNVPAERLVAEIRASLKELAAMNRELGMCALFQNHSPNAPNTKGPAGGDLNELYDLVKDFDPNQIGVAFDLGHAIIVHGDQWRWHFQRLSPHIRAFYVKDVQRPSRFVPFGQGEFGRTGFFASLAKRNSRVPLSVHVEYEWAPAGKKTRSALVAVLKENRRVLGQWWKGA